MLANSVAGAYYYGGSYTPERSNVFSVHLNLVLVVKLYVSMCMGAPHECAVCIGCHFLSWLDQLRVLMMIMVYT